MKRLSFDGRGGLIGALIAYALVRGSILWTAFDSTAMPMYELFPMGTLAELVRRGVSLPLSYLYDNAAGQLLIGLLTVPYFAILGPSYLALKLVPFTLGALTLVLVWSLLRKNFSPRAGALGAWLFALGPPTIVKYSLMNSGNHFENLFFTTLALVCFYRFHREPERMRWLFLSGVTAGLALFVFLGALIPIALCAGVHAGVRGLRRTLRDLRCAAPGFAVGIAPLVWINIASGARGVGFLQSKFGGTRAAAGSESVSTRVVRFLLEDLPVSTVYESLGAIGASVFSALFLGAFLVAYATSLPSAFGGLVTLARGLFDSTSDSRARFDRAKLVPFVLYLPFAALAFGVSNFRIGGHAPPIVVAGYRYFLPHLLFALVLVAIVAARWIERGGARRIAGVLLAAAPLCAGTSNLALIDWTFTQTDLGRRYTGYNLGGVGRALIASRNALSREQILTHLSTFPPFLRHRVAGSIGFNLGTQQIEHARSEHPDGAPIDLRALVEGYPEDLHVDLARGLGAALRFSAATGSGAEDELARGLRAAHASDPTLALAVAEGTCMAGVEPPMVSLVPFIFAGNARLLAASEPAFRDASARGCGLYCGRLLARGIESDRRAIETWLSGRDAQVYFGMGAGAADGVEPARAPREWRALVPESMRADFCRGFGTGLRHMYGRHAREKAALLGHERTAEEERAFLQGIDGGGH
ncbi:MAG: glycosyltransferase family 39 protein [Planctomycetota bacterium]